jgi:hypothetical protein
LFGIRILNKNFQKIVFHSLFEGFFFVRNQIRAEAFGIHVLIRQYVPIIQHLLQFIVKLRLT